MELASYLSPELIAFFQLTFALVLGVLLGLERVAAGRTAGPRTYGLVSIGSCLMIILTIKAVSIFPPSFDPAPMIASILTGIGFLGAGLIIRQGAQLSGVTTAAGIWVSAIIGMAVGFKYYLLAAFTTFLTLFVFTVLWRFEDLIKKHFITKFPERIQHMQEHDNM